MIRKQLRLFLLILSLIPCTAVFSQEYRFVINTGHSRPVNFLQYDGIRNLLFSGSEDGTLRVWDPVTGNLKYQQTLSRTPLRLVALNPVRPEAAVVSSDTLNSFVLSFWNWETGEKLSSMKLPELPLFMKYSPAGGFLVYGIANWESLRFVDGATGAVLPYLTEGFGIVSDVFVSASEKTVLTYSPSGYLQYWDVEQGLLKKRVPTLPNLSKIAFTSSGRYMAASTGKELVFIDLLTGQTADKSSLPDIDYVSLADDSDELSVYSRNNNGFILTRYSLASNRLFRTGSYANLAVRNAGAMTSRKGSIYLSSPDGAISQFNTAGESLSLFSRSGLLTINDMAVNSGQLVLTSPSRLVTLDSRFFQLDGAASPEVTKMETVTPPVQGAAGISWYTGDQFLIWTTDSPTGSLMLFSPRFGIIRDFGEFPYSFIDVSFSGTRAVTLDKNGECRVIDLETGKTEFQFTSFGLRTVSFTSDGNLLAGRSQSSGVTTPLLHINTVTGETVPIDDESLLISRLAYDSYTGNIYSLGIEERRGRLRTVLKRHFGRDYTESETILTSLGENLSASLSIQEESTRIYTSLGSQGVKMMYWGGFTPFEESRGVPGKILSMNSYLLSLNQDSSITFWNRSTGELVFTFYLFEDLNWIILLPEGKYMTSPGAVKYIEIFKGDSMETADPLMFRIRS